MAISEELKDLYSGNSSDGVLIQTLEISHPDTDEVFRLCDFYTNITCRIEDNTSIEFAPAGIRVKFPTFENKGVIEYSFEIQSIDFKAITFLNELINNTEERVLVKYRVYTSNNFLAPQMPMPLEISVFNITIDKNITVLQGQQLISLSKSIPQKKYVTSVFEGLS